MDQDVGPELLQRQVRVGAVPGDLGSRFSLLSKKEAASLPPGSALMTKAAAQAVILKAREDGATVVFDQTNPKEPNSKTARRYEAYKHCRSFAELAAVGRQRFSDGAPKLRTGPSTGDLVYAVMRGYCTFIHVPDPTLHMGGEDLGLLTGEVDDSSGRQDGGRQRAPIESTTAVDNDVSGSAVSLPETDRESSAPPAGSRLRRSSRLAQRGWRTLSALSVVATACCRSVDHKIHTVMDQWGYDRAAFSSRPDSTCAAIPSILLKTAVADTLSGATMEDDMSDMLQDGLFFPEANRAEVMKPLPRAWSKLRNRSDWETSLLPAIHKEFKGLWDKNVMTPVPCPEGADVVPLDFLTYFKRNGTAKGRAVARGDRTRGRGIHFTDTATCMATVTAIKMIVAFAAGLGIEVFAIDFEQAFLNAPVGIPDLYIQLPDLPFELRDKDCGPTRGTRSADGRPMVGRLNK